MTAIRCHRAARSVERAPRVYALGLTFALAVGFSAGPGRAAVAQNPALFQESACAGATWMHSIPAAFSADAVWGPCSQNRPGMAAASIHTNIKAESL